MAFHIPGAQKAHEPTTKIWNKVLLKNGMRAFTTGRGASSSENDAGDVSWSSTSLCGCTLSCGAG